MKIIDAHTHIYPDALAPRAKASLEKFYNFTCQATGTVDNLIETSKEGGVSGLLLLGVATNARQIRHVNQNLVEAMDKIRAAGLEVAAFGGIHQDCKDMAAELDFIRTAGLSGVKIHPDIQGVDIDDPRLMELYSLMEGTLPVYFHMGDDRPQYRFSEAKKLIHVMKEFPRLRVGAAHFGGYRAWDHFEALVAVGGDNIMFDSSSSLWLLSPEEATKIIHLLGSERIMFGTDYPVLTAKKELALFSHLSLTSQEQEDILYNNAKRFVPFLRGLSQ